VTQEQTMIIEEAPHIADVDRMRADLYNFLGVILSRPPDDMLLRQTEGLQGDETDLGQAIGSLAKIAKRPSLRPRRASLTSFSSGSGGASFCPTQATT